MSGGEMSGHRNFDLSSAIIIIYFSLRKFSNDEVIFSEELYNNWITRNVALPIESGEVVSA